MRQARPEEIISNTHRFGLEGTLNQIPDGLVGHVAHAVMIAREKYPVLTPLVPFVRISANVTNMLLDHSPAGFVKLIAARPDGELTRLREYLRYPERRLTVEEWQQLRAKVVLSNMVYGGLALMAMAAMGDDPEDPFFAIYGDLQNLTPDQRRQVEAQKVQRYTFKIGKLYFNYLYTPLALGGAALGNYFDMLRWMPEDKRDYTGLSTSLAAGYGVIIDQQFLSSMASLLGRGTQATLDALPKKLTQFAARTAGGVIPQVFKEVDSWVNPSVQQSKQWWEYFQQQVPVFRWAIDRPLRNALGEVIERPRYPWTRAVKGGDQDPVWEALAQKALQGVWLPMPGAAAKVARNGELVPMTDRELYDYQTEVGRRYRDWFMEPGNLESFKLMDATEAEELFQKEFSKIREDVREGMAR
jgi:hypothetical protein